MQIERDEFGPALLASIYFSAHRPTGTDPKSPDDFMPSRMGRKKPEHQDQFVSVVQGLMKLGATVAVPPTEPPEFK